MKIKDIIKLDKKIAIEVKKSFGTYFYENKTKLKYQEKNGYYWKIPCHSSFESLLLNNYEKDCVVAYVENSYFVMFLMKSRGKENYRVFIYFKELMKNLNLTSYGFDIIYDTTKFFKVLDVENLNVSDEDEYQRFKKLKILGSLQS